MVKIIITALFIFGIAPIAIAENQASPPPQKPRYSIGGVVNDMILLIDEQNPENSIYVQDKTVLENGCVVTKTSINCDEPHKKEALVKEVKESINIPALLNLIDITNIPFEKEITPMGKLKVLPMGKDIYIFINKSQADQIEALYLTKIKSIYHAQKINLYILDKLSIFPIKGE